ncbi:response regulator transcription factor [Nocardioides zhouii]|uniref:Response regulator transcription factor n=1 Tax=Nocardioides zhouii TaxID=1168729 RepID=A0A4Q2SNG3_9ACTN|nr:response regulator transcription factor [Nocardioides zhouii]RYC07152.1 response regulator transcription factor [Nocardioides zhouii]
MALALVVEDDPLTRQMLADLLPSLGHTVLLAATGREGLELAASGRPDVILLDLGLPDVPGSTVIARLREWTDTPILVVSGSRQVRRKADALDAGADDFIDKPFDVSELRARLSVAERRLAVTKERPTRRGFAGLDVDYTDRRVHSGTEEVRLTETEWLILDGLSREPGRVVTHRWLSTHVWGAHAGAETHQTMRAHVKSLRAKLGDDARDPQFIRTETGLGYRWVCAPDTEAGTTRHELRQRVDQLRDDVRRWFGQDAQDRPAVEVAGLMDLLDAASDRLADPVDDTEDDTEDDRGAP